VVIFKLYKIIFAAAVALMDGKETIAQTALPCPDANMDDVVVTPTLVSVNMVGRDIFVTSQYASKYF
jgi:hypothetical protein